MTQTLNIAAFCGSLRAKSLNRSTMLLAGESMPATMVMNEVEWRDVPAFDADVMAQGMPASVVRVFESIRSADGVLMVLPEYNFSIPGMFKNMLDWVSRGEKQPFAGKPVAILSATTGPVGGARMHYDLRRSMLFLNAHTLVKPEVFIGQAQTKFDAEGKCTDEATRKFVGAQMLAFEQWIHACARMSAATT